MTSLGGQYQRPYIHKISMGSMTSHRIWRHSERAIWRHTAAALEIETNRGPSDLSGNWKRLCVSDHVITHAAWTPKRAEDRRAAMAVNWLSRPVQDSAARTVRARNIGMPQRLSAKTEPEQVFLKPVTGTRSDIADSSRRMGLVLSRSLANFNPRPLVQPPPPPEVFRR